MSPYAAALARVAHKIEQRGECREWRGYRDRDGYGVLCMGRKSYRAHRVAYEAERGPIPAGLVIDHLCRNRACLNPAHMEPVTPRENTRRGENFVGEHMRRTHCSHGHPLSGENLYQDPRGFRGCRSCRTEATRRYSGKRSA